MKAETGPCAFPSCQETGLPGFETMLCETHIVDANRMLNARRMTYRPWAERVATVRDWLESLNGKETGT